MKNRLIRIATLTLAIMSLPIVSNSNVVKNIYRMEEAYAETIPAESVGIGYSAESTGRVIYLDDTVTGKLNTNKITARAIKLTNGTIRLFCNIDYNRYFVTDVSPDTNVISADRLDIKKYDGGQAYIDRVTILPGNMFVLVTDTFYKGNSSTKLLLCDGEGNTVNTLSNYESNGSCSSSVSVESLEDGSYNIYYRAEGNTTCPWYIYNTKEGSKGTTRSYEGKLTGNLITSDYIQINDLSLITFEINATQEEAPEFKDGGKLYGVKTPEAYKGVYPFENGLGMRPLAIVLDDEKKFKSAYLGECEKPELSLDTTSGTNTTINRDPDVYVQILNKNSEYIYRYTTDGTEPTKDDKEVTGNEIHIDYPDVNERTGVTVKVKAFKDTYKPSETASSLITFKAGTTINKVGAPTLSISNTKPLNRENVTMTLN